MVLRKKTTFWEKRGNYHFASLKVEIATPLTLLVYKQNSNPSNLRGNYHFASLKVEIATSLTLLVYKQNSNPSNLSVSKSAEIKDSANGTRSIAVAD